MMYKIAKEIAADYPEIDLWDTNIDAQMMWLTKNPETYGVLVAENMFGDIISDIAGMITGSLGMLPSASIGTDHALYEPVHGSAPDIAGQDVANPIAMISSVAMMFAHSFKMTKAAEVIEDGISRALSQGYRTQDVFSKEMTLVSTSKMTEKIIECIEEIINEQALGVFTL